eukprot:m51a1_g157 hypothetical protein (249) ;mRNA; r:508043-508940
MNFRFIAFVVTYLSLHVVLDVVLLAALPYTLLFDRVHRRLLFRIFWEYNRLVSGLFFSSSFSGVPFDSIKSPCLFIINHQTNWDHVFCHLFSSHQPRTMMKSNLLWYPVGLTIRLLDQLFVYKHQKQRNLESLDRAVWFLKNGVDVQVFPEGTRRWLQPGATPNPNELGMFHDGAFKIALAARVPIVPVVMELRHLVDDRHLEAHPGECRVHVCEPIDPDTFGDDACALRDRVHKIMSDAMPSVTLSD